MIDLSSVRTEATKSPFTNTEVNLFAIWVNASKAQKGKNQTKGSIIRMSHYTCSKHQSSWGTWGRQFHKHISRSDLSTEKRDLKELLVIADQLHRNRQLI